MCFVRGPTAQSCKFEREKSAAPKQVDLFPIRLNGKAGYIDKIGRVAIQPQFTSANTFSEGMAVVGVETGQCNQPDEKFPFPFCSGYIDSTGRLTIAPRFKEAGDFSDGRALVNTVADERESVYIDRQGKVVITTKQFATDRIKWVMFQNDFSEGLAVIVGWDGKHEKAGYIDPQGKIAIAPQFDRAYDFKEGVAQVLYSIDVSNKSGLIGRTGTLLAGPLDICSPILFGTELQFSEGYAPAKKKCFDQGDLSTKLETLLSNPGLRARAASEKT